MKKNVFLPEIIDIVVLTCKDDILRLRFLEVVKCYFRIIT